VSEPLGPRLEVEVEHEADPPRVVLVGEVDLSAADRLRVLLLDVVDRHPRSGLAVDLSGLQFMDSSGLGILISCSKRVGGAGPVRLVRPAPMVIRLLEVSGCAHLFDIVER